MKGYHSPPNKERRIHESVLYVLRHLKVRTKSVVSSVRRQKDPWSLTSAAGGATTPYDITSVEEVDSRVVRFTVDRVEFVDSFETWQYSDTSNTKL